MKRKYVWLCTVFSALLLGTMLIPLSTASPSTQLDEPFDVHFEPAPTADQSNAGIHGAAPAGYRLAPNISTGLHQYVFNFDNLTNLDQQAQTFGRGPYWACDTGWGALAWGCPEPDDPDFPNNPDINAQSGEIVIDANFIIKDPPDGSEKGFIRVVHKPDIDLSNKEHRKISAKIRFSPPINSGQILPSIWVSDRRDSRIPDCCNKWYRSVDFSVSGGQTSIEFDLDNPSHYHNDSDLQHPPRELKTIDRVGIQFFSNINYTGTIFLDDITIGGKEKSDFNNCNGGTEDIVTREGPRFKLNDESYRFVGNNSYYPFSKSHFMIDDLMQTMQNNGIRVLRIWGFSDGTAKFAEDDTPGVGDGNEGNAFQPEPHFYYEPTFVNFDYVVKSAGEHCVRLIIPLVNHWSDRDKDPPENNFGGIAQYVEWCDIEDPPVTNGEKIINKDVFYVNFCTKQLYKDYVSHMVTRTNALTGVSYKNDPTILAWELINEPRCVLGDSCPAGEDGNPDPAVVHDWAEEMSAFVKTNDPNHLVALGDEGAFRRQGISDDFHDGTYGIDWEADLDISSLDFGTTHLYPDSWNKDLDWAKTWIIDHLVAAQQHNKPVVFEEFGICDKSMSVDPDKVGLQCNIANGNSTFNRDSTYQQWTDLFEEGADGDLV